MLVAVVVLALNLAVWGAHARLPGFAAAGREGVIRVWRVLALPALGLSVVASLAELWLRPDSLLAWGMTGPESGRVRLLAVALGAVALADLVALLGGDRIGRREWRVIGVFGLLGLIAWTLASELLRIGAGPAPPRWAFFFAAALRLPLGLAAGELLAGAPRSATLAAGPALVAAFLLWPAPLQRGLGGDLPTLAAATLLLLASRLVPAAFRRAAGAAGLALAVLFLARAGVVSGELGLGDQLPLELLLPD